MPLIKLIWLNSPTSFKWTNVMRINPVFSLYFLVNFASSNEYGELVNKCIEVDSIQKFDDVTKKREYSTILNKQWINVIKELVTELDDQWPW